MSFGETSGAGGVFGLLLLLSMMQRCCCVDNTDLFRESAIGYPDVDEPPTREPSRRTSTLVPVSFYHQLRLRFTSELYQFPPDLIIAIADREVTDDEFCCLYLFLPVWCFHDVWVFVERVHSEISYFYSFQQKHCTIVSTLWVYAPQPSNFRCADDRVVATGLFSCSI